MSKISNPRDRYVRVALLELAGPPTGSVGPLAGAYCAF